MDVLSTLLTGLAGASSLFLVASGLTVIFGVTRVVNFSHGSLCMLGAYIGWSILTRLPRDPAWFVLGVLLTALVVGLIGVLIETALLRRIYRAPELFQLLATFGVVLMVQDLVLLAWGPNDLALPRARWLRGAIEVGDSRFPIYDLALIAVGPLVLGLLWLLFTRTRWGTLVRAATLDREMVAALGVDQRRLFTGVFALGAALAGLGGVAGGAFLTLYPGADAEILVFSLAVVIIGGRGSLGGAAIGALLVGLLNSFGQVWFPELAYFVIFGPMAAILAFRPLGLFGRAA